MMFLFVSTISTKYNANNDHGNIWLSKYRQNQHLLAKKFHLILSQFWVRPARKCEVSTNPHQSHNLL